MKKAILAVVVSGALFGCDDGIESVNTEPQNESVIGDAVNIDQVSMITQDQAIEISSIYGIPESDIYSLCNSESVYCSYDNNIFNFTMYGNDDCDYSIGFSIRTDSTNSLIPTFGLKCEGVDLNSELSTLTDWTMNFETKYDDLSIKVNPLIIGDSLLISGALTDSENQIVTIDHLYNINGINVSGVEYDGVSDNGIISGTETGYKLNDKSMLDFYRKSYNALKHVHGYASEDSQ